MYIKIVMHELRHFCMWILGSNQVLLDLNHSESIGTSYTFLWKQSHLNQVQLACNHHELVSQHLVPWE